MKLQELIQQTELDSTVDQIKAFFLGIQSADKPLPYKLALEELFSATPEVIPQLQDELKILWDSIAKNKPFEYQNLFPVAASAQQFLAHARDQLDYFLTALSLSGTHAESVENEDLADLIDELEDTVIELDDYLAGPPDEPEALELKEALEETWQDYVRTAKPQG